MAANPALIPGDRLDKDDFYKVIEEYTREDAKREDIIKKSRDVLKLSKQAIFALHRKDEAAANAHLESCFSVIEKDLFPITEEHPTLRLTGMLVAALEEYAEARIFLHFLKTRKLLPFKSLNGLRVEEFLGGLMDCTGELNRFAVLRATEHDATAVHDCCQFVGTVHEQMILLDLRNSPLRRKYDSLKYTQKRLEALVYELAVAARMQNIKLPSMLMEPEPETNANQE
ncbi:translin-associated protein X [Cyclospora cayetanensis]|uniref:Translin-associated protein X n=1 Tax=Cyclospora cayetanensis TaxID=88456 RepID=A0A6P6S0N3_9EIME|nr:translin-associated protein X [Cyclospora cayetanensis]